MGNGVCAPTSAGVAWGRFLGGCVTELRGFYVVVAPSVEVVSSGLLGLCASSRLCLFALLYVLTALAGSQARA